MKKYFAVILAALMLMSMFAGCGGKTEPAANNPSNNPAGNPPAGTSTAGSALPAKNADGKVVIRIGQTELGRLIEGVTPFENYPACTVIYDQIFRLDPWAKAPVSDILKEWYWEDDHTFVEVLRDDVVFSNGDKANAEDLLFSYTNHAERGSSYTNDMLLNFDKSVIRDEYTLALYVEEPNLKIFRQNISLYNKDWCEAQTGWDSEAFYDPVGSGPYYVDEFHYGDYLVLKPRDDYWNKDFEKPIVDEFYIKQYSDASAMLMDLEMGNIDLCAAEAADYSRFAKDPNKDTYAYSLLPCPTGAIEYISFSFRDFDGFWANEDLRRAIAYGVDLEALGVYINGDLNKPTTSFAIDTSPYYFDAGHYEYNPEKAQEYLKKAGVDPKTVTVHSDIMDTATYKNYAQGMEYYLKEMGFQVDFKVADIPASLASWTSKDTNSFNLFFNASGNTAYDVCSSMLNANKPDGADFQYVYDKEFSERFTKCLDPMISDEERVQLNHEFQQYIYEHCLAIPIAEQTKVFAYNKNIFTDKIIDAISWSGYYQIIGCCQASQWEN